MVGLGVLFFSYQQPSIAEPGIPLEDDIEVEDITRTFRREYITDTSIDYLTMEGVENKEGEAAKRVLSLLWDLPEHDADAVVPDESFIDTWMNNLNEILERDHHSLRVSLYDAEYGLFSEDIYYDRHYQNIQDIDLGPPMINSGIDALVHHYPLARKTYMGIRKVRDKMHVRGSFEEIKFRGGFELDSEYDPKGKVRIRNLGFIDKIEYGKSTNEEDLEIRIYANHIFELNILVEREKKEEERFMLLIRSR